MVSANYHTHNRWCKHASGEIEDYVKVAIERGLEVLAITDHVPHKDNLDARRIQWEEFEAYNKELDAVIEKYKGQIELIKGFECEYYPEALEYYKMFREQYGYRLLILGQHRSGAQRQFDNFAYPKSEEAVRLYGEEVCAGLRTGMFNFLAHPDLVMQAYPGGWDALCEETMRKIFATCEELDIPVEINANGLFDGRAYPCKEAFRLSREYKLRYLTNSDAHDPNQVCGEILELGERFAAELGIELIQRLDIK